MNARKGRMPDAATVKAAAAGRWMEILTASGIDAGLLDGRGHPCPRCGGTDRFAAFRDVAERGAVHCRRCFSKNDGNKGDGFATVQWFRDCSCSEAIQFIAERLHLGASATSNGRPKAIGGAKPVGNSIPTPDGTPESKSLTDAEASTRDSAYKMLLAGLTLSDEHRQELRKRGLSDKQVDEASYRTWPKSRQDQRRAARMLFQVLGNETFVRIPGFGPAVRVHAAPGLLIPVRDAQGRIIALKVRPDKSRKDCKYLWVSSAAHDGPSCGSPAHVPLGVRGPLEVVRVTEGHLKADVGYRLSGIPTVGFPGVSIWHRVLPILEVLEAQTVRVAFDADAADNPQVAQNLCDCVKRLNTAGYAVELERWPKEAGKGIDDVLAAGRAAEINTLAGKDALQAAEEIAATAGLDDIVVASGVRDEEEPKKSQATLLVELALTAELWHTAGQDKAYATLPVNDHTEHLPIRSKTLRHWLARQFFMEQHKAPSKQALADALNVIDGKALFDGPEYPCFVRVAECEGRIYLDLVNEARQTVEIDAEGWKVIESRNCPVRFRRGPAMLPLPTPTKGGDIKELRRFVNVADESWPLLLGWLVAAFRPSGPYPILMLLGEQGAAKSTTARVIRALVDPHRAPLRSEPREARDLMIAAENGWVAALDNLSYLPGWLSDALCRLSTGGGFATRTLYENDEETIFEAMRPTILNGIAEPGTQSDLLDRCVILQLPKIPEERRRTEADFWREVNQALPQLLGAILDGVSGAIQALPNESAKTLPRMADFALWAAAAETALGLQQGDFMRAYSVNRQAANETALEASPVAKHILQLADSGNWEGTATDLLGHFEWAATDGEKKLKGWPKNARSLSAALRRLATNLRAEGIEIEYDTAGSGRDKRRVIKICKCEAHGTQTVTGSRNAESKTENSTSEVSKSQEADHFKDSMTPIATNPVQAEKEVVTGNSEVSKTKQASSFELRGTQNLHSGAQVGRKLGHKTAEKTRVGRMGRKIPSLEGCAVEEEGPQRVNSKPRERVIL